MSDADKIRKNADEARKQGEQSVSEARVVLLRPAVKKIDAACVRLDRR